MTELARGTANFEFIDIYTSRNLHVDAMIFDRSKPICVTFPPVGHTRNPYGRGLSLKYQLNWVAVTCSGDDWFQYEDLNFAERAIRTFVSEFPRVVAYGASHGGFGALYCSREIGAHAVLAVAPQTFMGAGMPMGERRWNLEWTNICALTEKRFVDVRDRLSQDTEIYLVDDPSNVDRVHTDWLIAVRSAHRLSVPLSGHHPMNAIASWGLGSDLIREIMNGPLDVTAAQARINLARRGATRQLSILMAASIRNRPIPARIIEEATAFTQNINWSWRRRIAHYLLKTKRADFAARVIRQLMTDIEYIKSGDLVNDVRIFSEYFHDESVISDFVQQLRCFSDQSINDKLEHDNADDQGVWRLFICEAYWLHSSGDKVGALSAALRAASRMTAWGPASLELARAFNRFGDDSRAAMFLRRSHFRRGWDFDVHRALARNAEQKGEWELAAAIWTQAAELGCNRLQLSFPMARSLVKISKWEEALSALAPSLRVDVPSVEVQRLRIECLLRLERTEEATDILRSLISLDHKSKMWRYFLFDSHMKSRRYDEALAISKEILLFYPGDEKAIRQIDRASRELDRQNAG